MLSPDLVDDTAAASGADTDTDIAKPSKKKTRRSRRGGRKHRRSQAKESEAEVAEGGSSAAHARAQTEQQNGSDGGFAGPGTGVDSCFDSDVRRNACGSNDYMSGDARGCGQPSSSGQGTSSKYLPALTLRSRA